MSVTWKEKIEPSFDKIIKAYLCMLEDTHMLRNSGWFGIKEEYVEKWEEKGSKGWYKEYENIISELAKSSKCHMSKNIDQKERIQKLRKFKKERWNWE